MSVDQLSNIDKVSIVALAGELQGQYGTKNIKDLAALLGVPLMSESRNRSRLINRIIDKNEKFIEIDQTTKLLELARKIIAALIIMAGAWRSNTKRRSYAGWFKRLCVDLHDQGYTYDQISSLTEIDVDTLEGFKLTVNLNLSKEPIDTKSQLILDTWNASKPWQRNSLDAFMTQFCRENPTQAIARGELRQILINLGLHTPRGPKIKNEGAQVKRPFAPHALWEGDGKLIKVSINGRSCDFIWYAFIDQNTTLLVGSSYTKIESGESFLLSLVDGQRNSGHYPIGVIIDNRLEGSDLGPINDFCKSHRINVVRTFPGNPKTNGFIEGNFSIFEKFVGNISISGHSPEEISRQIATTIIEIFTQLRNHTPRKRLNGSTPHEATEGVTRPEHTRSAIESLARRLNQEQDDADKKWDLIFLARSRFQELSAESEQKIKKQLVKYTNEDLAYAQASYLAQIKKHPGKKFNAEYFLAILRNHREKKAKAVFSAAYRAGMATHYDNQNKNPNEAEIAATLVDEMVKIPDLPSPSHQMLNLDAIAWWLIEYSTQRPLYNLWKQIEACAARSIFLTLKTWSMITSYLSERIGKFIYNPALDLDDINTLIVLNTT